MVEQQQQHLHLHRLHRLLALLALLAVSVSVGSDLDYNPCDERQWLVAIEVLTKNILITFVKYSN